MRTFLVLTTLFIISYTSLFAEVGVSCSNPDTRCSAYELDVEAEVLSPFVFNQFSALNLGVITKGETVVVLASNAPQSRGRAGGALEVYFAPTTDGIEIECKGGVVYFGDNENGTSFDSCLFTIQVHTIDGGMHVFENYSLLGLNNPDFYHLTMTVGGTIQVPVNTTTGSKTGVMRIEFTYL